MGIIFSIQESFTYQCVFITGKVKVSLNTLITIKLQHNFIEICCT